jgi:hypothetical protein
MENKNTHILQSFTDFLGFKEIKESEEKTAGVLAAAANNYGRGQEVQQDDGSWLVSFEGKTARIYLEDGKIYISYKD